MRLHVLGSSGSSPVRGNPGSGYLVTHGEEAIWLDAGPGTLMALLDIFDPSRLSAIVISHTHLDHSTDFLGFYHFVAHGPGATRLPVFVPSGAAEHFGSYVASGPSHGFWSAFDFTTCQTGTRVAIGAVSLTFASANHSVPSIATRLEAAGRSLVYTGDTGESTAVTELAHRADVLLCEASMQGPVSESAFEFHMTAEGAGRMAAEADVGRLILTHLPPTLSHERSIAEAGATWGREPELARPGTTIEI
ncbi:MAG TPA: MBL fold metallo-hydrolase [Acidimicrobiia bacterium]|jgi:ribonuclease BN (tRNA processing enzyme)